MHLTEEQVTEEQPLSWTLPWCALIGLRILAHLQVVDHYENPRNVGSFGKNDADVGTGLVGAPACGDVMKLQIKASQRTPPDHRHHLNAKSSKPDFPCLHAVTLQASSAC